MATPNLPEPLSSFIQKNKSCLPVVVEIAEGIYGSHEKDCEVRDFSNGDILRLVSVKEEVNITFDGIYACASKKGLITVNRHFDEARFEVISPFKDGHVYSTLEQMMQDFPDFIRVVKTVKGVEGVKVGDRLKLVARNSPGEIPSLRCKNIRTNQLVKLSGDIGHSFAKKVDKSNYVVNLDSIYHRLPQRVRLYYDEGQRMRGRHHGIPSLEADFDGEMNLSNIEVVEACPWEDPNRIIRIPVSTDVFVHPRQDWGNKIGPVVDVHDLAKKASTDDKKVAVVVDQESVVPGCPKDTILLIFGSRTFDYAIAVGRNDTRILIPESYPSLFKVTEITWSTVEDLLRTRMCDEVHVGTTFKAMDEFTDTLYQHDVVKLCSLQTEPFYGTKDEYEVVSMDRSRSLVGKVGKIKVATFAKANFYESAQVIGDVDLQHILAHEELPVRVNLSQPKVSSIHDEADASDDLLLSMSPLEITGRCQISVTICQLMNPHQFDSGDRDVIFIPAFRKLKVRSIIRSTVNRNEGVQISTLAARVLKISAGEMSYLNEQVYEPIPPPIPPRSLGCDTPPRSPRCDTPPRSPQPNVRNKPPGRPPKPDRLKILYQEEKSAETPPLPPKKEQSSPLQRQHSRDHRFFKFPVKVTGYRHGNKQPQTYRGELPSLPTENPYIRKESPRLERPPRYEKKLSSQNVEYYENESGDDDDDYETPDADYEKPQPSSQKVVPPKDGNISAFELSDMVTLLEYLKVGRRVIDTLRRKDINGKKLCELFVKSTDESLQKTLGVDDVKDWLVLRYYIEKSVGSVNRSISL